MANKFIPDSDSDFADMARAFANGIAADPARYKISEEDSRMISRVVQQYRDALSKATAPGSRTRAAIGFKDEARKRAEDVVREFGNFIRANRQISAADKIGVWVKERSKRLRRRDCPMTAPKLKFVSTTQPDGSPGNKHVLKYADGWGPGCFAKPEGAVRIELFVDLVELDAPVPEYPGQFESGRPTYLRSFTKNPIEVEYPEPSKPMQLVYWGRWADATGEVGPWSRTLATRVWGKGANRQLEFRPATTYQVLNRARLALMEKRDRSFENPMLPAPAANIDDSSQELSEVLGSASEEAA